MVVVKKEAKWLTEVVEDDDSGDDYGPALPPNLAAARARASTSKSEPEPSTRIRPVIGPSLPSSQYSQGDEDEAGDIGPNPLPASALCSEDGEGVKTFLEAEERRKKGLQDGSGTAPLRREEWMLAPPTASDLLVSLDPKKLRATKKAFSAATSMSRDQVIDNTLWTETPAERQKRLAEEASGKRKRKANAETELSKEEATEKRRRQEADEEIRRRIEEHTKRVRGETLVEMHAKSSKEDKKDEFTGIWDHQRDMSIGGRLMSDRQRKEIIKEAGSLKDRFGSGKGGSFL